MFFDFLFSFHPLHNSTVLLTVFRSHADREGMQMSKLNVINSASVLSTIQAEIQGVQEELGLLDQNGGDPAERRELLQQLSELQNQENEFLAEEQEAQEILEAMSAYDERLKFSSMSAAEQEVAREWLSWWFSWSEGGQDQQHGYDVRAEDWFDDSGQPEEPLTAYDYLDYDSCPELASPNPYEAPEGWGKMVHELGIYAPKKRRLEDDPNYVWDYWDHYVKHYVDDPSDYAYIDPFGVFYSDWEVEDAVQSFLQDYYNAGLTEQPLDLLEAEMRELLEEGLIGFFDDGDEEDDNRPWYADPWIFPRDNERCRVEERRNYVPKKHAWRKDYNAVWYREAKHELVGDAALAKRHRENKVHDAEIQEYMDWRNGGWLDELRQYNDYAFECWDPNVSIYQLSDEYWDDDDDFDVYGDGDYLSDYDYEDLQGGSCYDDDLYGDDDLCYDPWSDASQARDGYRNGKPDDPYSDSGEELDRMMADLYLDAVHEGFNSDPAGDADAEADREQLMELDDLVGLASHPSLDNLLDQEGPEENFMKGKTTLVEWLVVVGLILLIVWILVQAFSNVPAV